MNEDDMLQKAKNLYFNNSIDSKGKYHQSKYIECWRFMKDKVKWKAYREKSTPKKPVKKIIIGDTLIKTQRHHYQLSWK